MGFSSVYKVLQEIFPQVDSRVLRAVAIEHMKDADVAVEVVLAEVMPFLSIQPGTHTSSDAGQSMKNAPEAVEVSDKADQKVEDAMSVIGGNDGVYEGSKTGELVSRSTHGESGKVDSGINSERIMEENMEVLIRLPDQTNRSDCLMEDSNGFVNCSTVKDDELSNLDDSLLEASYSVLQDTPSPIENCFPGSPKSSIQLLDDPFRRINSVEEAEPSGLLVDVAKKDVSFTELVDCESQPKVTTMSVPDTSIMYLETQEPSDFCAAGSKKVFSSGETYGLEEENDMDAALMTQSGQICTTELLGDIIENARIEKITLRSAKDSLVQLMNEVELKEKSVEQARQEAAQGGLSTFSRAEEVRRMTQRAKEENDMHAGEIYGEKAILATEVRELQSRLLFLSDERVKALAILDEMRLVLEARLAVTEKEIEEAHRATQEKEESAQKYLAYEESIMEKVVQESKILKQEAEENSKLREFLMDRGRVVDMLQGEISVICQDVKLMKDKFQEGVTLNKSLSSSQITRVLASSSSSSASAASKVLELADSPENPMASARTFADDQFYYEEGGNEEGPTVRKEFMDAGWEFFDDV